MGNLLLHQSADTSRLDQHVDVGRLVEGDDVGFEAIGHRHPVLVEPPCDWLIVTVSPVFFCQSAMKAALMSL